MKAMVRTHYGSPDVLQLKDIDKPIPQADEVLIKVHATSLNAADWRLLRADPFFIRFEEGLFSPNTQILGADIAGQVEAVGSAVTHVKVGDEVFGDMSACGFGGLAEYVCASEKALAIKPASISFEEASAVPMAAGTALQGLRDKGKIKAGQSVLINGASGGVGTFAVQIAKAFGAEVTGVCSTSKLDMVRSLGADHVIDYTQTDVTQAGQSYDLILAANGYHPISAYKRILRPQGTYVVSGGGMRQLFEAMLLGPFLSRGGQTFSNVLAESKSEDLAFVGEWLDAGKISPVIDKRYPLHELPDAMRYLEAGHARGKVVITMDV